MNKFENLIESDYYLEKLKLLEYIQAVKKKKLGSSLWGTMRSLVSLQHQDAGLIPGLAQWIRGFSIAAAVARFTTVAQI